MYNTNFKVGKNSGNIYLVNGEYRLNFGYMLCLIIKLGRRYNGSMKVLEETIVYKDYLREIKEEDWRIDEETSK